jgi:hypothetical protein
MRAVTRTDVACVALALAAWVGWLAADAPALAAVLLTAASVLAFLPTFRKTWVAPDTEPPSKYVLSTVRYILATLAVQTFAVETALYPGAWIVVNATFLVMLLARRRAVQPAFAPVRLAA